MTEYGRSKISFSSFSNVTFPHHTCSDLASSAETCSVSSVYTSILSLVSPITQFFFHSFATSCPAQIRHSFSSPFHQFFFFFADLFTFYPPHRPPNFFFLVSSFLLRAVELFVSFTSSSPYFSLVIYLSP